MAALDTHSRPHRATHCLKPSVAKSPMVALVSVLVAFLLGCAPADESGSTGSVGLLMTDAPSDDFEAVNMTFTKIELIGGRSGRATVFEGLETFDLLALRDASELFSITGEVPTGRYDSIRLTFAERGIELVGRDGRREHPELPQGNRVDFRPGTSLEVNEGTMLIVEVDIDVDKSIHRDGPDHGLHHFRPVIHTQIVKNILHGRMVRLHGTVVSLDSASQSFKLCHMRRPHAYISPAEGHGRPTDRSAENAPLPETEERHHPRRHCIDVSLADNTSIFDEDGEPLENLDQSVQGQHVMLAGRIGPRNEGMNLIAMLMLIGPPGSFHHLRGVISTDYDEENEQFGLERPGDRPDLTVQVNHGTKLFERGGGEVDTDAIMAGLPAGVTGLFRDRDSEGPVFQAVVIGLDLEEPDMEPVRGEIVAIRPEPNPETNECRLELESDEGERLGLAVAPHTRIFLVDPTGMVSSVVDLEDLIVGDRADVYGPLNRGDRPCRPAGSVIAFPGPDNSHSDVDAPQG